MAASDLGSLCYLAGQVVCESDVQLPTPRGSKRALEEALTALRKGALLLKHGRHGKPKVHFFRVSACDTLLKWRSASGSVKQVKLRNVSEVVAGQGTEVFRRYPLRDGAASFSLRYRDEDGGSRTLDLTAADPQQLELWLVGLRVVAARLAALGTPVSLAAAPGGGGLPPPDLARRAAARLHAAPGPLCMDAGERTPCDLLAWGAAQRAPAAAPSARSVLGVADDCWQHRAAPAPAPGALRLDAFRAAVGRKHAAVITATGALYAWGEGRGGKLGLGHDQDQAVPQKVRHVLDGRVLAAVACGDDCTAALTDAGELFVWGRLHVDARPQLVPLRVRGELRSRRVVQVSCGPFHCAAVSSDGQLFTWGEGFGGKLGHGDQGNRSEPALVAALAGRQVLEAACGVWHTAAIVVEPEGGPPPQHSPLKGEGSAAAVAEGGGGGGGEGGPPASPAHGVPAVPHHHRNNSTSSAFSEASVFHDGAGGALYTWGGVNESVAFGAAEKRDSNRGCLGHGEADLYRGQLLPSRVGGALEGKQVRHVAAGSHLTVAVTTGGRVFQMGATGASAPAKHCPWEGATLPEPVRGALAGYFIDEVCCGMHHVVAAGRPLDRRGARPADAAPRAAFAWGRGSEGQLGVRGFDDSAAPLLVEGLKGRSVLQVAAGGSNTLAVCEHDVRRWEPESKEEGEAAARVLAALAAEPKAPRTQSGEGDGSNGGGAGRGDSARPGGGRERGGIVRRSFSMIAASARSGSGGSGNGNGGGGGGGGPPALGRLSSGSMHSVRSVGGASAAGSARGYHPSFTQTYSFAAAAPPPGRPSLQLSAPPPHPLKLQRLRSDRTTASSVLSGEFGGSGGGSLPPPAPPSRVVSIGSPARSVGHGPSGGSAAAAAAAALRRSTFAGYGGPGGGGFPSARSFTGGGFGGAPSDLSSLSSWQQRPLSDDGAAAELEAAGRRVSSTDLAAALDDARSRSSSVALAEELAEKNRIIERLQIKLEKAQRQQVHTAREREAAACAAALAAAAPLSARAATPRPVADAEEQLREAVKASAGAFRAAQQAGSPPPPPLPGGGGSRGSPPGSGGGSGSGRPLSSRSGLRSSGGLGGNDEEAAAQLAALEAMLARKEAHLEGQQRRLAEWAAELQRREAALSWRQAQLAGVAGSGSAAAAAAAPVAGRVSWAVPPASGSPAGSATPAPEPIPSDSPVLAVRTTNGAAPARAPFSAAAASPAAPGSAAGSAGGGTQPGSPSAASATATAASADEWSEEFEEGVFLTFTSDGGAKKLRRIRFNRTLFSATSAKQWYEANKHRLAQPTGTPRLSSAATTPPATAASLASTGGSYPGTPLALAAAAGSVAAASGGGAAARVLDAAAEAQAVAGLLHYRQTSRNLSFDARELATFHERLQAALGQQPPGGGGGGGGSAAARPPSRLGKPPRGASAPPGDAAAGSLPGSPFAAAAATPFRSGGLAEEGSWPPPSGMVTAEGGTPATASPAPPAGGDETSREFGSARSSPLTADSFLPASRDASASAATAPPEPSGLGRRGSGASAASGASSPIRAGGGSRGGSPLAKSRSGASSLGKQQSGGRAELAKFTPRAADAPDAARSASAASSQASPAAEGSGGETQRSASSFSAKMGRIRRSLTGGGSGGKKK